jgi:hypothetical protein
LLSSFGNKLYLNIEVKPQTKKGEGSFPSALFLPSFPKEEGSDYNENKARYAFNVIRR